MRHSETPDTFRRPLEYLAIWQLLCFLLLICLVWAFELLDVPYLIFGGAHRAVDVVRLCLLTAGILVVALITVGQTYLQQQRMLNGIIVICSYCHKVRIDEATCWLFVGRWNPGEGEGEGVEPAVLPCGQHPESSVE